MGIKILLTYHHDYIDKQEALRRDCIYNTGNTCTDLKIGVSGVY